MPKIYNVMWDTEDINNFRNNLLIEAGHDPLYEMKCNQCLTFIGTYNKPEDIPKKFCSHCGNKIEEER